MAERNPQNEMICGIQHVRVLMDLWTHVHLWCSYEYLKHFTTKRDNFERTMRCVSLYYISIAWGITLWHCFFLYGCSWIFFIVSPIFQHCLGFHPPWSWIAWAVSTRRTTQRQQLVVCWSAHMLLVEITIVVRWNVLLFFLLVDVDINIWCPFAYDAVICMYFVY